LTLGKRALPPRSTALGRALHEWRTSLIADLGGVDTISTQQLALVDLAVRTKLLVDSVDAYVLGMPSPVNRQRRCLHPGVRERAGNASERMPWPRSGRARAAGRTSRRDGSGSGTARLVAGSGRSWSGGSLRPWRRGSVPALRRRRDI